ncbi:MAG: class I SAM-dependent methyltransferase [Magnetococcales bacterium]|nr:class I SAM-dependent methyltransferase [Magnetococcales bacterium]
MAIVCRICATPITTPPHNVTEMMYGSGEVFQYYRCQGCDCLQIGEIPDNIDKFYPTDYYSLSQDFAKKKSDGLAKKFKNLKIRSTVLGDSFLAKTLHLLAKSEPHASLTGTGLGLDSHILDVGCGAGGRFFALKECGFNNVAGLEPNIPHELSYDNGFKVYKSQITNFKSNHLFDLITFFSSFEHIANPLETLQGVKMLLALGGRCLIKIPVFPSLAWEMYKENWVQLDAPRHLFLYSIKSLEILVKKAGFAIQRVEYDSSAFQYWGSEQYKQNITLKSERSYGINKERSIFSKADIKRYKKLAKKSNAEKTGDQATILLKVV